MTAPPGAYLLDEARIDWAPDGRPVSRHYNDFYHGALDAIAEKRHVFLELNELRERWTQLPRGVRGHYTIVELGFGFGINFLLSCELWSRTAPAGWTLHYLSIENEPVPRADLERAGRILPPELDTARLQQLWPAPCAGFHRRHFAPGVRLTLLYLNAADALEQLDCGADSWFLDGFRPDRNPAIWSDAVWRRLAELSRPGATFSTYSAAGWVRRGLESAGLMITKGPGFGRKKELLRGRARGEWRPATTRIPERVAVIGGGLAGCACARSLAERDVEVTLFETQPELVRGASGMHQLAYYPELSVRPTWQGLLSLAANQYLEHRLAELQSVQGFSWQRCGLLRLAVSEQERARCSRLREQFARDNDIARWIGVDDMASISGLDLRGEGILYRTGGWLDPAEYCGAQLASAHIETRPATTVSGFPIEPPVRRVIDGNGKPLWEGEAIVLANGFGAHRFPQFGPVPLTPVRGQTSHLACEGALARLRVVVGGDATVFPAHRGICNLAASYTANDLDFTWHPEEDQALRGGLTKTLGTGTLPPSSPGRVGIRCVSRDRFPVVGMLPDWSRFLAHHAALARNAHAVVPTFEPAHTGLWAMTAFGSHGLNLIPLACEHLAAQICSEPSPLPRDSSVLMEPARFVLRDLKQQRVR